MLTLEDTNQVFLSFVFYIIFFFSYLKIRQQDIIKKNKERLLKKLVKVIKLFQENKEKKVAI